MCNSCGKPTAGIITICEACVKLDPPTYEVSYYFKDGRELVHRIASYGEHRYYGERRGER